MRAYLANLALALDQLANAITGGDPDESVSSRVGKCRRGDHGRTWQIVAAPAAWIIDKIFGAGHCLASIEADEGARDLLFYPSQKVKP